nr:MAG TPA: hypothetical protein [Caudoviricetes sp.]
MITYTFQQQFITINSLILLAFAYLEPIHILYTSFLASQRNNLWYFRGVKSVTN